MARSKNATALFEVIHAAKKPPKSSTSVSVPTPKWWSKSKPPVAKPAAAESTEPAGRQGSWLAAAAKRGVLPTNVPLVSAPTQADPTYPSAGYSSAIDSEMVEPSEESTSVDYAADPKMPDAPTAESPRDTTPKPRFAERFAERFARKASAASAPTRAPVEPVSRIEIPSVEPEIENTEVFMQTEQSARREIKQTRPSRGKKDDAVAVDRGAKEVRFRLSYGGLISLAFIFLLVVALAVLVGSRFMSPAANESADDGKKPSDPMMLATTKTNTPVPAASPPQAMPASVRSDVLKVNRHPAKPVTPFPAIIPEAQPVKAPITTNREVGTTYIVMQTWDDKQIAQKACDYLNKNGISCSLVRGLDGWAPRDWYSVVGLQPFATKDATLGEYQKAVTALGIKFSNKAYNRFEPKPYVWQANSDSRSTAGSSESDMNVDR